MRISKEEAAANRAKVLAAAARLFREKGVDGIAVAELMQAAGLTHGGFYNHFESKEELAAAAFREAFAAAVNRVKRQAAEADKRGRDSAFAHYVGRYLAPELGGELPGLVLVGGADEEELPAPHDRPAFALQRDVPVTSVRTRDPEIVPR